MGTSTAYDMSGLQKNVNKIQVTVEKTTATFNSLKEKQAVLFENSTKKSLAFLLKLKAKLLEFKSDHQRDDDGIETKLFTVVKVKYNVVIQPYHGETMHGKEIQKVMENSTAVFEEFGGILKANRRVDYELSDDDITNCVREFLTCVCFGMMHSHLLVKLIQQKKIL